MKNLLPFLFCIMPFLAPDDGGLGGGAPPAPFDFAEWIKRMEEAKGKERPVIAGELAKVLNIPIPEVWKRLKEAGWNPPKDKPPAANPSGNNGAAPGGETKPDEPRQAVSIRHKTPHPRYRRAGLALTDQFKPYEVTAGQLAILETDPWVEIKKGGS